MSNEQTQAAAHQADVERVAGEVGQAIEDGSQSEVAGAIRDALVSGVAPEEVAEARGESEEQLSDELDSIQGE